MNTNNNSPQSTDHPALLLKLLSLFIFITLITLFCIFQQVAYGGNKLIDDLKPRQTQEKTFSLHFDEERQQLKINGTMDIGILPAFKNMLLKHPESTTVVLNSNGGNIYQARGLAKEIISRELNTHITKNCYSACTIVYVAGKIRYISQGGKLGFHQYDMKSKMLNQRFDLEKEQTKDLSYFKTRIFDKIFIKKIFSSKNSEIWIPKQQDLINSGIVHKVIHEPDR